MNLRTESQYGGGGGLYIQQSQHIIVATKEMMLPDRVKRVMIIGGMARIICCGAFHLVRPSSIRYRLIDTHVMRATPGSIIRDTSGLDDDIGAQVEAERIMKTLEKDATRENMIPDDVPKYMPSLKPEDPVVIALKSVLQCHEVTAFELLDSRWNGNEAFRYDTNRGSYFVKLNRVEDPSVFMTEAVSLSALAKTQSLVCPVPLHIGKLPKVGDIGPGAFMVLDWLKLLPFGAMRSDIQKGLGDKLADLHLSKVHDDLHKGRFGFPVSNFLALTPLNNEWCDTWVQFFTRRMSDQLKALFTDKIYGRAALVEGKDGKLRDGIEAIIDGIPNMFYNDKSENDIKNSACGKVTPSLLHGDLWIGNVGGTPGGPCCYDPASFFGHSEFDLSIMELFGGYSAEFYTAYHKKIPKEDGFEDRKKLYQLYHYLNQLNLFGDAGVALTVQKLVVEVLEIQQTAYTKLD